MGYATQSEVIQALANALSKGVPQAGGGPQPITSVGTTLASTVKPAEIQQYIRWADTQIDGAVHSIYETPLQRVNEGTYILAADVTIGDTQLILEDATRFVEGDIILLRDSANTEELTIDSFLAGFTSTTIVLTAPVVNGYLLVSAKVERIRYPDPIPNISARLAAAAMYDKHFAAQVEGNKSDYGKELRKDAWGDLDQILSGAIPLAIADANQYVGRRYYNHALDDVPATKAEPGKTWFSKGT